MGTMMKNLFQRFSIAKQFQDPTKLRVVLSRTASSDLRYAHIRGPSIKNVRSHEVVQCGHFVDKWEWVFRCEHPHFLVLNTSDFWNLWCVRTDKGEGIEPVRISCGHAAREGVSFSRFCADFFYGRPLKNK